jgi:hypothetical protein
MGARTGTRAGAGTRGRIAFIVIIIIIIMIIICVHFSLLCLTVSTSVTAAITAYVPAAVHTDASAGAIHCPATDTAVSRAVRTALILILLPIPLLILVLILVRAVSAHLQFVGGDIVFQCAPSRSLPTRCLQCKSTYVHTLRFHWIIEMTYRYVGRAKE